MANTDLDLLLKCIEEGENYDEYCNDIVQNIKSGKKQFLSYIESLESEFTSNDVNRRLKGTQVLSSVLKVLPSDQLKEEEIAHITAFLCAKLKDHHNLIPVVLQGLNAIVQMENLTSASVRQIVDGLSVDVQNQLQTPKDRLIIYKMIQILLDKRLPELQEMGTAFVFSVIGLVDSECNATNLKLVFATLPRMLQNFTLAHLAEDMFEALACYFPIDVPTEGKDAVPRENLAYLLETCLTSSTELAKYTLPLLQEKLDSDLTIAKKDALSLLTKACQSGVWGASELAHYLHNLGFSLQREACRADEVSMRSLTAITSLVHTLSASAISKGETSVLPDFVHAMTQMNQHALQQVELRGFTSASLIISALARGSQAAANLVCGDVVPTIISQFQARSGDTKHQAMLLATLTQLLAAHISTSELESCSCSALYLEAAGINQEVELRAEAFNGLACIAPALSTLERVNVYRLLQSALVTRGVSASAVSCLYTLAKLHPQEVLSVELFEELFEHKDDKGELAIAALCSIGTEEPFLSKVAPRLVNLATNIDTQQQLIAVKGLQKLSQHSTACQFLCSSCNIIQELSHHWLTDKSSEPPLEILTATSNLISTLLRAQDAQYQTRILQDCESLLHLDSLQNAANNNDLFSTPQKCVIGVGLLGSLHITVEVPQRDALVSSLTHSAIHSPLSSVRDSCGWLAACILNKTPRDYDPSGLLECTCQLALSGHDSGPALILLMRLTRALLLKGFPNLDSWILKIIELLSDHVIGTSAAETFSLLISEENTFLTVENHATVRLLYRQRLAQYLPQFESAYRLGDEESRPSLLLAMTHIIHAVNRQHIQPHLPILVPILICSLKKGEVSVPTSVLLASLGCLEPLLQETNLCLASHITDLTTPCLHLASQNPSMKVRIAALQCIHAITNFKSADLISLKNDVLDGIKPALDDPKRLVRKAAVRAAGKWHFLGKDN